MAEDRSAMRAFHLFLAIERSKKMDFVSPPGQLKSITSSAAEQSEDACRPGLRHPGSHGEDDSACPPLVRPRGAEGLLTSKLAFHSVFAEFIDTNQQASLFEVRKM